MAEVTVKRVAADVNIQFHQGDDVSFSFRFKTSDDELIDLSDYEATAQIRKQAGTFDTPPLATFVCVIDGFDLTIDLSSEETSDLPNTSNRALAWDLQLINSSGKIKTFLKGDVTVDREVTREVV